MKGLTRCPRTFTRTSLRIRRRCALTATLSFKGISCMFCQLKELATPAFQQILPVLFIGNEGEPDLFRCQAACAILQIKWNDGEKSTAISYRNLAYSIMAETTYERPPCASHIGSSRALFRQGRMLDRFILLMMRRPTCRFQLKSWRTCALSNRGMLPSHRNEE